MFETTKLFEHDAYLCQFEAHVISCEPEGDRFAVILDQTTFYPEGGGQLGDQGVLAGLLVLDVRNKPEGLVHFLPEPLIVGSVVQGEIDWSVRFDRMQHHSAEHVVSGIVKQQVGFENVGFHMGREIVTVDFNGVLDDDMVRRVEDLANQAIYENVPVHIDFPSEPELAALDYRSKKAISEAVRIVTVEGVDRCACCGTHVHATGEIGLIRFGKAEKYKGGTRVTLLCGGKAFQDYRDLARRVQTIAAGLSTASNDVVQAVERLKQDLHQAKRNNQDLKNKVWILERSQANVTAGWVIRFEDNLTPDDLQQCCQIIAEKSGRSIVLSADEKDSDRFRYAMFAKNGGMKNLAQTFNQRFKGRGGGSDQLVQGTIQGLRQEIEAFFKS